MGRLQMQTLFVVNDFFFSILTLTKSKVNSTEAEVDFFCSQEVWLQGHQHIKKQDGSLRLVNPG